MSVMNAPSSPSEPGSVARPPASLGGAADRLDWFRSEVQPHGERLESYLRSAFPAVRDIEDVVQESFLRLWKARATQPVRSARGLLFTVARRVALDLLRRGRISPIDAVEDMEQLQVPDDRPGVVETVGISEKVRLVAEAPAILPPRCREVVVLRKIKGFSQREVAARLGIAEKTVDEQLARGIRRLEGHLRRQGVNGLYRK